MAEIIGGGGGKKVALKAQAARQMAWLKRKREGSNSGSWQPPKRHRKAACQFTCCEHNSMKRFLDK
eukprot:2497965-Pyramimonas_sp.AAC.1